MGRTVTLVLVDASGTLLGALPPFEVPVPWWPEVADVVAVARSRDGVDLQVLRLLHADPDRWPGGEVTYLAQVTGSAPVGLAPIEVDLSPHPNRAAYAEPGGPAATVGWGLAALAALGTPGAVAVQQRTWNLSAIWRLDVAGEPVAWLKQVPRFFRHEPAVLGLVAGVAPGLAPPVLAAGEQGRMLLAHVPGTDQHDAGLDLRARIAEQWHPIQTTFAGRVDHLLAAGVPDRRLTVESLAAVAQPYLETIDGLPKVIEDLPARLDALAGCGMPDTLVHGDLHPGNTRAAGGTVVIMDWGDSTAGHPALDILRLAGGLPDADAEELIAAWALRWRVAAPGSDPRRAIDLLRPVAELRAATVYAGFLAAIEPAERPYHLADVPAHLTAAARTALR
ncbi:MAG TPA: phosphotransferase [Actinoplanes sp.]|nr:phosphotransferase [Actinoplanes sp.]